MNIHEDNEGLVADLNAGQIVVGAQRWNFRDESFWRFDLADPATTCLRRMRPWTGVEYVRGNGRVRERQFGYCLLDKGHLGRHGTVVFYCDNCGHSRLGSPAIFDEDVNICFLCKRSWDRMPAIIRYGDSTEEGAT